MTTQTVLMEVMSEKAVVSTSTYNNNDIIIYDMKLLCDLLIATFQSTPVVVKDDRVGLFRD